MDSKENTLLSASVTPPVKTQCENNGNIMRNNTCFEQNLARTLTKKSQSHLASYATL